MLQESFQPKRKQIVLADANAQKAEAENALADAKAKEQEKLQALAVANEKVGEALKAVAEKEGILTEKTDSYQAIFRALVEDVTRRKKHSLLHRIT